MIQAFISDPNAWITLIVGACLGALPSWLISRHFYRKTPDWAAQMLEEMKAMQDTGDVDFVAQFERALSDHDIELDGGKL